MTLSEILEHFDVPLAQRTLIIERAIPVLLFERPTTDKQARERLYPCDLKEAAIAWVVGRQMGPPNMNRDSFPTDVWRMGPQAPGLTSSFERDARELNARLVRCARWPQEGTCFRMVDSRPARIPWAPCDPPAGFPIPAPSVREHPRLPRSSTRLERTFGPTLGTCAFCQGTVTHGSFRDDLSRREWLISKLCQLCQDKTFVPPADEEEFDGP